MLFLGLLLAGCGGSDESGSPSSGGSGGAGGSGGTAGMAGAAGGGGVAGAAGSGGGVSSLPAKPSNGCTLGGAPGTGSGTRTLSFGGVDRSYELHVPTSYDPTKPAPLVMNFHGRTASSFGPAAPAQEAVSKLNEKGDAEGFFVINPQGITDSDGYQTWNAGLCCAEDKTRDDVGFADAILDEVEAEFCLDTARIYAAGLSNGGFMSHRLACEKSERYAAVAPVAAFNGMTTCDPARGITLVSFNGTTDPLVPYNQAVPSNADWVSRLGCDATPKETFKNGDSSCNTWTGCKDGAEIVLCTVEGGGHTWPGGLDLSSLGFGKTTQDMSANDVMWEVFQRHALP